MKKKIKSIAIVSILLLSMSISLIAVAAKPDKKWMDYEHRVHALDPDSWSFPADTSVFMLYGWATSDEEFEAGIVTPPKITIFVDGEEVKVFRYTVKMEEEGFHSPIYVFYAIFDPFAFEVGEHHCLVVNDNGKNVYSEWEHPLYVEDPAYPPAPHPKLEGYDHRIIINNEKTWVFPEDMPTFILYGWATLDAEFEDGIHKIPVMRILIDGEEVEVHKYVEPKDMEDQHSPYFYYYVTFDPYSFEPGEHEVTIIIDNGQNVYIELSHPIFVDPADV